MPVLSGRALAILDQMESDRGYEASELRALVPELTMDGLREVMHELWIAREVERFRDCGWRRVPGTPGQRENVDAGRRASANAGTGDAPSLRIGNVRPEDLFDHESFAGWFK